MPSLQQYCYDLLAEYSGYIEDLDGIYPTSILEIGLRSDPFGLANIESIAATLDLSSAWERVYNSNPSLYTSSLIPLVKGQDFHRQVVLCSTIQRLLNNQDMDDEDLLKFLSLCNVLKILEIRKISRLTINTVLCSFNNLIHLDMTGSKVGPEAGESINGLICRNHFLQTLNLKNCILLDIGVQCFLQSICHSKLTTCNLSWNNLTLSVLSQFCEIILSHMFLSIVDISNNVTRGSVVQLKKLTNHIRSIKKISIT